MSLSQKLGWRAGPCVQNPKKDPAQPPGDNTSISDFHSLHPTKDTPTFVGVLSSLGPEDCFTLTRAATQHRLRVGEGQATSSPERVTFCVSTLQTCSCPSGPTHRCVCR